MQPDDSFSKQRFSDLVQALSRSSAGSGEAPETGKVSHDAPQGGAHKAANLRCSLHHMLSCQVSCTNRDLCCMLLSCSMCILRQYSQCHSRMSVMSTRCIHNLGCCKPLAPVACTHAAAGKKTKDAPFGVKTRNQVLYQAAPTAAACEEEKHA